MTNNSFLFRIKYRVCRIIDKLYYLICKCFTRLDKNLIIFEGTEGEFDESSWVLYHHIRNRTKRYKYVWMVKVPQSFPKTDDTIFISRYSTGLNLRASYYYSKAGFSFYTHTTSPTRYRRKGQNKVFIGHGYAIKSIKGKGKNIYNNFDYGIAIGENAKQTQAIFVGCKPEELLPLGLPRNDLLYNNIAPGIENPFVERGKYKKVFLWMPTFRESIASHLSENDCATETGLPLFSLEEDVFKLNAFLKEMECVIILKVHRLQLQKHIFMKKFSNIIILKDSDIKEKKLQLYEIIGKSDALITDYSSVSIDYLLTNKPIGYILCDIDYYKKDRGFTSENPLEVMPGNKIYNYNDFYGFITQVLHEDDFFQELRQSTTKYLHAADKGNSCELIENHFKMI